MAAPFVFRKVLHLVEAVGIRAGNLDELLRAVNVVDPWSLAFHMHHDFIAHKFVHSEYPNDFAMWASRALGDAVLAERLATLRVFRHRSLETLRAELGRLVANHLMATPESAGLRAQRGMEFHFQSARPLVMDVNRQARDLSEFAQALSEAPSTAVFFHLFETRFHGEGTRDNDFAEWIGSSLGELELAKRVADIDPYMFSLEEARKRIVALVQEHVRRKGPPPPTAATSIKSSKEVR